MKIIIYNKKTAGDYDLFLKTINDEGYKHNFRIPGILKSKKRSAYHMCAGSIWSFTISGNMKSVMTPKEINMIYSPFSSNVSYDELMRFSALLKPLEQMMQGDAYPAIFKALEAIIRLWPKLNENGKESAINYFYVFFLKEMGLLNAHTSCVNCGCTMSTKDLYLLSEGSLCHSCVNSENIYKDHILPLEWILLYVNQNFEDTLRDEENFSKSENQLCREKILNFL
ncbi:MAG: DNA repair protein RecO C-terminal domain-containing protein [Spirochaetia bacterium]|nr:DNA repair protein RecO C-terminal domain-containing protein [Spirochaetia bacterium]